MKAHCIILADDLSGAADCAVPFARAGFSPEVFLQPECAARTDAPIVSIDLNTRELTPEQAVQVTSRTLRLIRSTRETVWYQKIDSTLRGNIGPDVLATVGAIPAKRVIFCAPAFPATGRTTIQGRVFVNAVPLEKSGVNTSWSSGKSISDLFAEVGLNTRAFSLDVIRPGSSSILRHLENSPGVTVAVCDAETDNDLLAVAKAGLQILEQSIFVGSAGLAHQIATLLGTEQRFENHPLLPDKPILVVVGSKSPASRAQFEHLSNLSGINLLRLPVAALKSETDTSITDGLTSALAGGQDLAITTELTESLSDQQGAALMQALGRKLKPFLVKFSALVLTGGETARGLLSESEIGRLRMMDEIEPGVTLSITAGKLELPIVMKAGAFGTQATLLNAVHFLRSRKK
jgi:D-threonate/D-erythronate kinase